MIPNGRIKKLDRETCHKALDMLLDAAGEGEIDGLYLVVSILKEKQPRMFTAPMGTPVTMYAMLEHLRTYRIAGDIEEVSRELSKPRKDDGGDLGGSGIIQ